MKIYVHTSGRVSVGAQKTLEALRGVKGTDVAIVVQAKQAKDYELIAYHFSSQMIILPPRITSLSPTRQWILDQENGTFCLMDDDLSFFKRREDDPTKFQRATVTDKAKMLKRLEQLAAKYGHAGILGREGGNRILSPRGYVQATRMMRVLAYHAPTVKAAGARFDRVPSKQDFDMTLQMLRAGHANAVITDYVQDQGGSNTQGGCSVYRDETMNVKSSQLLAKLHPQFVTVVEKETKTAWGGGIRTDVRVAWKKALGADA